MTFRKHSIAIGISMIGSTALSLAPPAMAAEEGGEAAITVTAQSRSQSAQSVPIPLQVVTSEQMDKLGANNLGEVNGYIPGLTVDAGQPTQPNFTLRGLGASDFGIGTDSPVGVYVDGVYTGKTGGSLMNFNDVQRIEVLKGPQGTLFGRNSAAGAISIVNNEPDTVTPIYSGRVRLGEYGERNVDVLLNQPINEQMALRFSAVSQRSDGWLSDAATGEKLNGTKNWGTRLAFRWEPSLRAKLNVSWEHEELDQKARPAIGLVALPDTPALPPVPVDTANYLDPRTAPVYNDAVGNREGRIFDGLTARLDVPLGWADFRSTTAYRRFHSINHEDNDGTNRQYTYLDTANIERNRSWQQEFRFSGKDERIDWVAGLSFFHENAKQNSQVNTYTDTLDTLSFNMAGLPIYSTIAQLSGLDLLGNTWQENMYNEARNRAQAIYGDVIWHLSPAWNLTTGLRFTRDKKEFSWYQPLRNAAAVDAGVAGLSQAGFFEQVAQMMGQDVANQLQGFLSQNQLLTSPGASGAPLTASNSWTDWSPRLVLDYKLAPDHMVYASLAKGYQAGGYNALQQVGSKFDPETVRNVEFGIKSYFRDAKLLLNASVFAYRFTNLQQLSLVNINSSGVPQYQVTTSDQKAEGLDLEARWQAARSLQLTLASEYLNQRYGSYTSSAGTNLSGQPVGNPKWTVAVGADYTWSDVFGGKLMGSLQNAYTSAHRCNADSQAQGSCLQTNRFTVGAATNRTDLRLRWDAPSRRWNVALLVNNLFDRRYVTGVYNIAQALGSTYGAVTSPRTTAIEFGISM
ncbi:TonB-dependent receptor [Chitinimonas sp.]|uniref:TonB-dependent receptor n=1 Tax=Chitinimonas sp. TaxID=1934313 RepID=UPI002F937CC3